MIMNKPVAVEGFADQAAQAGALASEGFAGVTAHFKPPEGLAVAGDGAPPKVDGFGGGATAGVAPPVEGFGDSGDNRGLNDKAGGGYLDQEEEESLTPRQRAVDTGPGSEEEADNGAAKAERLDLEPGWEEAAKEKEAGDQGDQERGEEAGAENNPNGQTRLVPYATLFGGKHRFTAQLKAHGYGGFHEWQMQWIKQVMENGSS